MYIFICERTTSVRSENLTSGQIFFKEYLIWLVRRDSFSKELFRHSINTIREYEKTFNANISIFQEKIIPNSLSKRGAANSSLHPLVTAQFQVTFHPGFTTVRFKPVLWIRIRKIFTSWIRIRKNIRIHGSGSKG